MDCSTPCPSLSHRVCSNLCPFSPWCHPTISFSVFPFSSCPQSLPASASFPELALHIRCPKYKRASASASVLPMTIQGWFPFRFTGFILLAAQGTLKSLFQHHYLKASILQHSAFFIVQLLHSYMTTGKNIALTIQTFVRKVLPLLFNILSRFFRAFLPRNKHLLISWL